MAGCCPAWGRGPDRQMREASALNVRQPCTAVAGNAGLISALQRRPSWAFNPTRAAFGRLFFLTRVYVPRMPRFTPFNVATGGRLVAARRAAGFNDPEHAARELRVDAALYLHHEQGRRRIPDEQLARYAEAFGVSIDWLSIGVGEGPQ